MSEAVDERATTIVDDQPARKVPPPRPRSRSTKRNWIITIVSLLVLVILIGGSIVYLKFFRTTPVQYVQQSVTTGNLTIAVSATGPIQPKATYNMNFGTSGQVQSIDVHIGQSVKTGQTLATLNSDSLKDALTAAQHKLTAAQTTYNDAVAVGATQSVLDQDTSAITSAQDGVNAAQDALNAATLKAPANAVVAAINGTVGQSSSSGGGGSSSSSSSSGSAFIVLTDTSAYTITAQVNEADIAQVKVGQNVKFTLAAFPSKTFTAHVSDIQTQGQTTSNVVSYNVDLAVDQQSVQGQAVYPGMTATASIITNQVNNVLLVPNSALTFSTQALQQGELSRGSLRSLTGGFGGNGANASGNNASGSNSNVSGTAQSKRGIVVELQNGKLVPVLVQTGLTDGQYTQIISGLNDGDSVVTSQIGGTTTSNNALGGARNGGLGGGIYSKGAAGNGGFGGKGGGNGGGARGGGNN